MLLPSFAHYRPETLKEALSLMASLDDGDVEYALYGGGTDVIPAMKRGLAAPQAMISLSGIAPLSGILKDGETISIGALTTLNGLISHPLVIRHLPVIADTARKIATPQIRSQATIGGNVLVDNRCTYFNQGGINRDNHGACYKAGGDVCHFIPRAGKDGAPLCRSRCVSDLAPVLTLLGARLRVASRRGEREIPISELYPEDGMNPRAIAKDEVLTSIVVGPLLKIKVSYEKLRIRNAIDFASLGVAAGVEEKENRRTIKLCIIGMETRPLYQEFPEERFSGNSAQEIIEEISKLSIRDISPLKQDILPPPYRKSMIPVLVRRMLSDMI